mmetsp:Transcript_24644/g.84588  ORF Transcript_24644/g.84588 Transcript_24644/m.84588 type:complete len:243 (-) Transcript_24644:139-867(-)
MSNETVVKKAGAPRAGKKPWENCADFEPDLTLEMSNGSGSLRVNRLILATNSTLVRDCSLEEPIPITVSSISALETLCRVMYANALTREQFSFPYEIFTVVTEVYELATFLGCKKILETFQTELEKSIQDLISKDKSEVKNLFGAFDALIVIESVCKNKVWMKNELTLLYRCVHFGNKSKFSIVHAKQLSPKTMLKVLQMSSQTDPDVFNSQYIDHSGYRRSSSALAQIGWTPNFDGIECKD